MTTPAAEAARPTLEARVHQLRFIERALVDAGVYTYHRNRDELEAGGHCALNLMSGTVESARRELQTFVDVGALEDADVSAWTAYAWEATR